MKRLKLIAFVAILTSFLFPQCEEPVVSEDPVTPHKPNINVIDGSIRPKNGATDVAIPNSSKYIWIHGDNGPTYETLNFQVIAEVGGYNSKWIDTNSLRVLKDGNKVPGTVTITKEKERGRIDTLAFTPKNPLDFNTTYEAVITDTAFIDHQEYRWSFTTRKKWEIKGKEVSVAGGKSTEETEEYQLSNIAIVDGDLYVAGYSKHPPDNYKWTMEIGQRAFKIHDGRMIWEHNGGGLAYKEDYDMPDNEWAKVIVGKDICLFHFGNYKLGPGQDVGISRNGEFKWYAGSLSPDRMEMAIDEDGWFLMQDTYYIWKINPATGRNPLSKAIFTGKLDVIDFWVSENIGLVMFGHYGKYGKNPGFALWTLDKRWLVDFPLTQEFTHAEAVPNGRLAYLINENTGNIQARKFTSEYTEDIWEKNFPISKLKSASTDEERNLYLINEVDSANHQYKLVKIAEEGELTFETTFGRNLPMPEMKMADWPNLPTQMEGNVIFITWWDKILRFDAETGEKLY